MRLAATLLVLLFYIAATSAAADRATYPEQEPNDECGAGQAVNFGDAIDPGCIDELGDHDWYTFEAYADDWISIATDESDGLPAVDTYITLYAEDCVTILTYDDDSGPGAYSLIIDFVAPYTGVYHLKVQSYGDYYIGCYQCSFDVAPPPPLGACCLPNGACTVAKRRIPARNRRVCRIGRWQRWTAERTWRFAWKPVENTRFASSWRIAGIRCWETENMVLGGRSRSESRYWRGGWL